MSIAVATNVRWRIVATLIFGSAISYVLRYNVSAASASIVSDLGLTEIQFGWILAAFTLGYTVFQYPGGLLSLSLGVRRAMTAIMLGWGFATLMTAAAPGSASGAASVLLWLVVVRFLVGALHAPIYPLSNAAIERWFPLGRWALPQGFLSTGLTLGIAVSTPILAAMTIAYGWRMSFVALSPFALIAAALFMWIYRDDPAAHPSANEVEVKLIRSKRLERETSKKASPIWIRVVRDRNVLLLTASYFCTNYVFYQFFNWVFYYFVSVRGIAEQQAGYVNSIQWIAAAIGATAGGYLCDRLTRRFGLRLACRWTVIGGMVTAGFFVILASLPIGVVALFVCLALAFLFSQLVEASYWAASMGLGGRLSGATSGVMNTGGNAVGFVNALLVPLIAASFGWPAAMASAGVFAFIAAGLWLFIRADEQLPD